MHGHISNANNGIRYGFMFIGFILLLFEQSLLHLHSFAEQVQNEAQVKNPGPQAKPRQGPLAGPNAFSNSPQPTNCSARDMARVIEQ
jgi:hypothetical protein